MNHVQHLVSAAGGLLHRRDLVGAGVRDRQLTAAVRTGTVRRPRRGWYSTWAPEDPRFVAVRVGGRLTGFIALAPLLPWSADGRRTPAPITVSVPRNAARLRPRRGVRVVYDPPRVQDRGSEWAVHPRDALARAIVDAPFDEAVALLDWAMHSGALTRGDVLAAVGSLPEDARGVLDWADPRCDSYPESIARTRLRRAGHAVRPQLPLPTGERVDLLVNGAVALEIDGRAFHEATFERDQRKDLTIAASGLVPLRVSARMIATLWPQVVAAVERASRTRSHGHRSAWVRAVRETPGARRRWHLRRSGLRPAPTW
ncbi:glycyl-tRNA synthetase [Curtobacterium sp. MCBD17_028]|uniref:glycyl-tRNA synthetase n=1 Tax=Curtobacterium sp. MCBD17_028 TaxID=2175670 RepID=UPI000DA88AE4|nr:glycyl-tRNA synthetase [Curtobacterium sp. MCBD17_028]PZE22942.1 glycyl-tRNA synthetase [Curtobacterium sp. MCBD17_028]